MTKTGSPKYQCGCGKFYSSYPAYSNHKKSKHDNHQQPGTKIPRPYQPKRGRPSFSLPQRPYRNNISAYSALSCVQIGLLKLQEKYKGLLTEADEEANIDILNQFQKIDQTGINSSAVRLLTAIRKFTETIVTHLSEKIGEVVVDYLFDLAVFILDSMPSEEVSLEWEQLDGRVDCGLFNRFFQQKGQLQRVCQLARQIQMPIGLILNLTVLLSQYLGALDLATSTLTIKA